ncbi:MAG: proline--tRNA ligase [Myxococcales bacterium FL481]|nr:MAG: proline--tRNA ligase [Myxococcales bacterium FL481]
MASKQRITLCAHGARGKRPPGTGASVRERPSIVRITHLLSKRTAETPRDAGSPSHQLLVRGGYVRQMGQGIYTLLPLAQRVRAKVEAILREEMNRIGGQEMLMPVVTPAELWQRSGRYDAVGSELLRFVDRTGHPHVLNMTNEETVVDAVQANVDSYRQLPFLVYHIQTKFRDEPRSRAGLIRVREFTMKDGYSFHRTAEDLESFYEQVRLAYKRIFWRCGLRKVVDIRSDVGMMGGKVAHEFMLCSPYGEDTLLLCSACDYRGNREVVPAVRSYAFEEDLQALEDVATPGQKTIEEVSTFLGTSPQRCCKAVLFMAEESRPIAAFVRGDLEIDQAKLRNAARVADIRPLREDEMDAAGLVPGFVGPVGLDRDRVTVVIDRSVAETPNLVTGGNALDLHRRGFNATRDLVGFEPVDISQVLDGEPCPTCGSPLEATRGIEVGNIFQLGVRYSKAMELTYAEEDGSARNPIMGCYGIGVGRTLACVVEEHHDDRGPIWPASMAPYMVQICALQAKKPGVVEAAEQLYAALQSAGVDVLLDTREVGAGFMFADADLIAAPVRVIISPRNLAKREAELKYRLPAVPDGLPGSASLDDAVRVIGDVVEQLVASAHDLAGMPD